MRRLHTWHTRTGLYKLNLSIGSSLSEHLPQSNLPQWRQWWRRVAMLNLPQNESRHLINESYTSEREEHKEEQAKEIFDCAQSNNS